MVGPTKRNPRRRRSALMATETGLSAGIWARVRRRFSSGRPCTKPQMYLLNDPNSPTTSRNARALAIAARILARLRIIPALAISRRIAPEAERRDRLGT